MQERQCESRPSVDGATVLPGRAHTRVGFLRVTRPRLLLPLAGLAFALAGCGASSDPLHTALTAVTKTLSDTALGRLSLSGGDVFGVGDAPVLGKGAYVFTSGVGYEAIDRPGGAGRVFLVFLPTKVYVAPSSPTALPSGKSWISAALVGPNAAAARFPGLAAQLEGLNPQLLLDEIVWGAVAVAHVGDPVVNHLPLSEYRVTVDLPRALSRATGPAAGAMRSAIDQELATLATRPTASDRRRVPITIWLDGPGRLVRVEAAVPGSRLGTVSFALSGFGSTFAASFPPASALLDVNLLTLPSGSSLLVYGG